MGISLLMPLSHTFVRQWNHGKTGAHTSTEISLIYLAVKGIRRAGIDEVPKHVEHASDGLLIGIHLAILLIVETLQFKDFPVLPVATFIILGDVIQLRVETEHMKIHRGSLNILHCCQHVTNELTSSCSGWMNTDSHNRLFQGVALLSLGTCGSFRSAILIPINSINEALVRLDYRVSNLEVKLLNHILTSTGVTDDKDAIIQPPDNFRLIPKMVIGPRHQRPKQRSTTKENSRQLMRVCIKKQLLHTRIILRHFLQFFRPLIQRQHSVNVGIFFPS